MKAWTLIDTDPVEADEPPVSGAALPYTEGLQVSCIEYRLGVSNTIEERMDFSFKSKGSKQDLPVETVWQS